MAARSGCRVTWPAGGLDQIGRACRPRMASIGTVEEAAAVRLEREREGNPGAHRHDTTSQHLDRGARSNTKDSAPAHVLLGRRRPRSHLNLHALLDQSGSAGALLPPITERTAHRNLQMRPGRGLELLSKLGQTTRCGWASCFQA